MDNTDKKATIKYFSTVAALVAILCFIIFSLNNRIYRSEIQVLLIARNQTVDGKIDSLTESAKNIPLTLSFYDRIIKTYELDDPTRDWSSADRKAYWNREIKTERVGESDIIKITAFSDDKDLSGKLAQVYATEFTQVLAQYYNIKNQLDSRIIDETVTYFDFNRTVWPNAAKSILWGILAGIIDLAFINLLPSAKATKRIILKRRIFNYKNKPAEDLVREERKVEPDYIFQPLKSEKDTPKSEPVSTSERKSAAPGNLPVADNEAMKEVESKLYSNGKENSVPKAEKTEEEPKKEEKKEDIFREATPEEVKERLNKLLSGKL